MDDEARGAGAGPSGPGGRTWTFLSNHGHVLVQVSREPRSRLRDVAEAVGITERSAQAILRDLETGGYVSKERVGRRNHYVVHPELAFRHPAESGRPVGALLRIFAPVVGGQGAGRDEPAAGGRDEPVTGAGGPSGTMEP